MTKADDREDRVGKRLENSWYANDPHGALNDLSARGYKADENRKNAMGVLMHHSYYGTKKRLAAEKEKK